MFASKDLFFSKPSGYQISRSVRLRSSATAYFNRTPASAGNRKTWTWSAWVKRGDVANIQGLFLAANPDNNNQLRFLFNADATISVLNNASASINASVSTVAVYRDPSAWYHIVLAVDTTQAVSTDRIKLYVNGVMATVTVATAPTLNLDLQVNAAALHKIGQGDFTSIRYFDGYLTEVNFIDGQALTPSSFGETNAVTGVWQPKKYTGTYGTNGFYLNFSDNSSNTATTIGKDNSGNGNNWTPNNISVTAGVTYDSMLDVPTLYADGGNGRGNYAVLNPLDKGGDDTVLNGNLAMYTPTSGGSAFVVRSSIAIPVAGKWYWEGSSAALNGNPANNAIFGVIAQSSALTSYLGSTATGYGYFASNGNKYNNGAASAYGATYTSTDVIGIAFDADAGTLTFYKNNVSQGTAFSGLTGTTYFAAVGNGGSGAYINFGQQGFTYTPPTGYVALNTQNLPTPTISNGANYMAATTYTGTGATLTISNSTNNPAGITFQPDFVWVKGRSGATDHALYDSVRGATKDLVSNSTAAETTQATGLTAFGSTGFTVGALAKMNTNAATYVGWQWQAGGTAVSNTAGTITSSVSANPTAGFSVVTYTGTGVLGTVGHGLGAVPAMIILKSRSNASNWYAYHKSIGNTGALGLNLTSATITSSLFWNNTSPTSSVFTINAGSSEINGSGLTYVAYCFAEVAGYSKFGSYTGNGSTDGPFVYLGFRPRFIMIKRTDSAGNNWVILDTSRDTYNAAGLYLYPNLSAAEDDYRASTGPVDILSNGFKQRSTLSNVNASGATYIFAAFSEVGFKYALGR